MKKFIFNIFVLPIILYKLALLKYSNSYQGVLYVQIFQYISIALVSQGHKDFDHNEINFIYSKAIRYWKVNQKLKTATEDYNNSNLQTQIGSFRNLQLYFPLSGSFFYPPITILTSQSHFL